jgi:hypothetical protein
MHRFACLLILALLLATVVPARASAQPVLSVSLSSDRPMPGEDVIATVVIFDGAGDVPVSVELPAGVEGTQVVSIPAAPVGLTVLRLHVRGDAAPGARMLRFRADGRVVERQIYVGVYPWPRATFAVVRRLPIVRR